MNRPILLTLCLLTLFNGPALAAGPLSKIAITPQAERSAAPGFVAERLDGGKSALNDFKGKVVLLNFWATWCMPCRQEMPSMETLRQKYNEKDLLVVAISIDEGTKSQVASFIKRLKLGFPVLLDPEGEVSALYKVSGLPASYLIDRDGKLISRIVGSEDWASAEAFSLMDTLLAQ